MKRLPRISIILTVALVGLFMVSVAQAEHAYIGATKCKTCHNTAKMGKIYDTWMASAHAKAYTDLASDAAKAVAKEKGIEDAQKADACLKCHVTGHGAKAEMLGEKYSVEEGVTCEGCHGAGGDYWKNTVMKALADGSQKPEEVGFLKAGEATCKKCHNEESPTFKGFDYAKMSAKIEHKKPAEAPAE